MNFLHNFLSKKMIQGLLPKSGSASTHELSFPLAEFLFNTIFLFLINTFYLVDDFLIKVWWLFIVLLFHFKELIHTCTTTFLSVPTFAIPFPNSPETFLCDYNICFEKLQTANLKQELHIFFCFHYSGLTFMDEVSNTSKLSVN